MCAIRSNTPPNPGKSRFATTQWSVVLAAREHQREGGREALPIKAHPRLIKCVAFSPDGSRLASDSDDKTVKIWKVTYPPKLPETR